MPDERAATVAVWKQEVLRLSRQQQPGCIPAQPPLHSHQNTDRTMAAFSMEVNRLLSLCSVRCFIAETSLWEAVGNWRCRHVRLSNCSFNGTLDEITDTLRQVPWVIISHQRQHLILFHTDEHGFISVLPNIRYSVWRVSSERCFSDDVRTLRRGQRRGFILSLGFGSVAMGYIYANKQDGHAYEYCSSKSKQEAIK